MTDRFGPRGPSGVFGLTFLSAAEPFVLLALRVLVGGFLAWGVWDNVVSADRMSEFAAFLASHGFAAPALMAPLSVWAQLLCGAAFILGLGVRWAGLICAVNFAVAVVFVDAASGSRAAFPASVLCVQGLYLAARGAGPLGLDRVLGLDRARDDWA